MKNRKIITMLVIGMFLATTIWTYSSIENVKAEPEKEVPLDRDFIELVAQTLAGIADQQEHWMGRFYGSPGEEYAANQLETLWKDYIDPNDPGTTKYPIKKEKIDMDFDCDFVDKMLEIENWDKDNYMLKVDGVEVDKEDYQPVPCLWEKHQKIGGEYTVRIPPIWWYINFLAIPSMMDWLEKKLKNEQMLYEFEYNLLNNSGCVSGDVVYIEDYETVSINDTEGRIHLVEIEQNASDEVFDETINKVYEYNGTAYIIMTTNPTFIDKKDTIIPGLAISRCDGEKLKDIIKNNNETIVLIEGDPIPQEGNLKVYCYQEEPASSSKDIYLIDGKKFRFFKWEPWNPFTLVSQMWLLSLVTVGHPPADAFFYSDINDDTHVMGPGAKLSPTDFRTYPDVKPDLVKTVPRPIFMISGGLAQNLQKGDKVDIKINSKVTEDVLSYNVIGEVPGKSTDQIIIGGHYDSYWGQCAMDNSFAPAIAWGIAKYFKDNEITPEYTLKLIAWGGEEDICRGSFFYVNKHLYHRSDVVYALINIDPIGMNTKTEDWDIPFTPWVYPGWDDDDGQGIGQTYRDIIKVMDADNYMDTTGYPFYYPHQYPNEDQRRDKPAWGISDTDAFCAYEYPETNPPLVDIMIHLERWPYDYDFPYNNDPWFGEMRAFFDHRSGNNFQTGDVWSKVDTDDVWCVANMALDLVMHLAVDTKTNFNDDCSYLQQDLDGDGNYDSVKITFNATTNISSWGRVESRIYQNGQPQSATFETDLINLSLGENTTGNLTVTLPPNATAGNCDIRVYLKDTMGNQDDFKNTTIYLYPYNSSVADFTWERNNNNYKMINFTDQSMPSPNSVLTNWNWSFGDGNYSDQQNCSHSYSNVGTFNVTLTVTDSANKSANVTKQVKTFNTPPVASFTVNSSIIVVNKSLAFNSTSSDVDGSIVNTTWYFGDNTTGYGADITHTYSKSGFYTISLVVTDDDNSTGTVTETEHVRVVDALVDDGFTDDPSNHKWDSIQEGINDVSDDGMIYVYNGIYQSYLVNKSVSIYGESKDFVLIDPQPIGIDVQYHDVYIKNFTINGGLTGVNIIGTGTGACNVTIENGAVLGPIEFGVYIDNSTNNTIKGCKIDDAVVGIKICNGAEYNVIDDCNISKCYHGVGVDSSSYNWIGNPSIHEWYPNDSVFTLNTNAVYLRESDHNYILGCDIDTSPPPSEGPPSTRRGIYLDEASNTTISTCNIFNGTQGIYIKDSRDNKVEFCRIIENSYGIEFFGADAENNLIAQNNITENLNYGVYLPPFPKCNKVLYNDFFNNGNGETNQSYDGQATLGETNSWCKLGPDTLTEKGPGEGNYWNDYTGVDLDSDGVGDTEYSVEGDGEDDYCPLMEKYGWCNDWG